MNPSLSFRPFLCACVVLMVLHLTACFTTPSKGTTAEIRAEQVLSVAAAALDSFLAFEHRRRSDVPPLVRDVASRVRREALKALDSANALRIAYKSNRTPSNEAGLLTALAVVETFVSEIRVWVPATAASGSGVAGVTVLIFEARNSKTVTAQSWTLLVPVFIDLAREVFAVVNRTREAAKQTAEWNMQQEAEFSAKLMGFKTAPHWSL